MLYCNRSICENAELLYESILFKGLRKFINVIINNIRW